MIFYVTRSSGTKKNDEENELKHYGIKGQQWGKRNYQYEDGSLTPAGKDRYLKKIKEIKAQKATPELAEKFRVAAKKQEARDKMKEKRLNEAKADAIYDKITKLPNAKEEYLNTPEYKVYDKMMRLGIGQGQNFASASVILNGEPFIGTQRDIIDFLFQAVENGDSLNDLQVIGIYKSENTDPSVINKDLVDYMEKHKRANK